MDHISGFFSRYLSPYLKHQHAKESVAEVCSEILGMPISSEDVQIVRGVCTIKGNHGIKHQIFLHQEELLRRFKEETSTNKIYSII